MSSQNNGNYSPIKYFEFEPFCLIKEGNESNSEPQRGSWPGFDKDNCQPEH